MCVVCGLSSHCCLCTISVRGWFPSKEGGGGRARLGLGERGGEGLPGGRKDREPGREGRLLPKWCAGRMSSLVCDGCVVCVGGCCFVVCICLVYMCVKVCVL